MDDSENMVTQDGDNEGIVRELGNLPPGAVVFEEALSRIFSRHPTSVKRAVERGEIPPPVRLFGKPCWTVGAIQSHLEARLMAALEEARKEAERIARLG